MTDMAVTPARQDAQVIGLVAFGHFSSHFFQLVLPPLFPLLALTFGCGYAELGALMTVFYVSSGLAQTASGFIVDRLGANRVLPAGLALLALGMLLIGLVPAFWMMFPLVMLAGFGNSVFHPANYAIMTHRVQPKRLARAYSLHTLSGTLGWAAAPVTMLSLVALGSWRIALVTVGLAGIGVAMLLVTQRSTLAFGHAATPTIPSRSGGRSGARSATTLQLLTARPVLLCFVYFTLLAVALVGMQTFLPTSLMQLYKTPLAIASAAVTAYLLANGAGTLFGGWLADRTTNHDRIVAIGLAVAAALVLLIGSVKLADPALISVIAVAGFMAGITTPSRDMLVRGATPPGSTGKVFGFVYSGLDLGSSVAPLVLGVVLDHGHPGVMFQLMAGALAATILAAVLLKGSSPAPVAVAE
ncbi:MAG TPA: MFS transporter [Stellaceae bacterium]|nr:MFS transporter [Stellaceae bacterium]